MTRHESAKAMPIFFVLFFATITNRGLSVYIFDRVLVAGQCEQA